MADPIESDTLVPLLSHDSARAAEVVLDISAGDDGVGRREDVAANRDETNHHLQHRLCLSDQEGGDDTNPFDFMAAPQIGPLRPQCPIDPFRNHTPTVSGLYEWLKILVCLPLTLARLVLFGLSLAIGFVATKLALEGWKDKHNPMPRWRCRIMWITRICTRCILFSFGYHWIRRKGRPASRENAPIVVSNHVSYIEPIFFFYELFPTMVSSESHDSIPFVGTIIRAMQVIYVDRFSAPSRKHAVSEIKNVLLRI